MPEFHYVACVLQDPSTSQCVTTWYFMLIKFTDHQHNDRCDSPTAASACTSVRACFLLKQKLEITTLAGTYSSLNIKALASKLESVQLEWRQILRYITIIWIFFLLGHLYLIVMWFGVARKMDAKVTCFEKIELRAQNMNTILDSMVNIIGGTYITV